MLLTLRRQRDAMAAMGRLPGHRQDDAPKHCGVGNGRRGRSRLTDDDSDSSSCSGSYSGALRPAGPKPLSRGGAGARRSRGPIKPMSATSAVTAPPPAPTQPAATLPQNKPISELTSLNLDTSVSVDLSGCVAEHVFLRRDALGAAGGNDDVDDDNDYDGGGNRPRGACMQRWDTDALAEIDAVVREVLSIRASKAPKAKADKLVRKDKRKSEDDNAAELNKDESDVNIKQLCVPLKLVGSRNCTSPDDSDEYPAAPTPDVPGAPEPSEFQVVLAIPYDNDDELIRTLEVHMASRDQGISAPIAPRRGVAPRPPSARISPTTADLVEEDQIDRLLQMRAWRAEMHARVGLEQPSESARDTKCR